jgi:type IV pilus assembly protein PilB
MIQQRKHFFTNFMNKQPSTNTSVRHQMPGLLRSLWQAGFFSLDQVEAINTQINHNKTRLIDVLLQTGTIDAKNLALFCSKTYGYPLFDLSYFDIQLLPEKLISTKLMKTEQVICLSKRNQTITVGISDPSNTHAIDQIKFQTGFLVEPIVVQHDVLLELLSKVDQKTESILASLAGEHIQLEEAPPEKTILDKEEVDDAPIVKFLQKILIDAINANASDIHFEPFEKSYQIRFRIDGTLQEIARPPLEIKDRLASRIKVISKLDISEKRIPQDGRMKLSLSKTRTINFRVSTLPTLFGEKIVIRILNPDQNQQNIDTLGYDEDQKELILNAITRPHGMILVTGPTGSGKTISLYTFLSILNKSNINISSVEDPVEINLVGINQVNINEKVGLTFSNALKSFLRQDPDVIMIGEIRDLETADISIKAAQTGHMVLSTLHTNDAPATLTRLMNMGVAPYNIASSISLITAQRLVRRLCHCKQPVDISKDALLKAGFTHEDLKQPWQAYKANGCTHCNNTGYKGRVGIYQVMPISEEIQNIILSNGTTLDIKRQSIREGVKSLRRSGLIKVMQGITNLEEVLGNTNE